MKHEARVLIADDASFMRQMIRDIIEPEGYEVVGEASDGVEVVEKYKELHPDVVMMDIVMPKRSGIDAVKAIMADDPERARRDVQRARPGDARDGGDPGGRAATSS